MTREQIRQEAEESVNRCTPYHAGSFIQGYIAGAENREEKIADLKSNFDYVLEGKDLEIKTLGERCNQLLKDKGNLTDELQELKETLAHTVENDEVAYETLKLHDQEEIGMLNSKVTELEKANEMQALRIKECNELLLELKAQIEKMKCCGNCKQRELIREHGQWKERFNCKGNGCVCYNKWRLKND